MVESKDARKILFTDLEVGKEDSDYTFEVKEPEFASLDVESGNVTALKEGETAVSTHYFGLLIRVVYY